MDINFDSEGFPILNAFHVLENGGVHLAAWCPKCKCRHLHGANGSDGHRVAHCANPASFPKGYVLQVAGAVKRYRDVNRTVTRRAK